MKKLLIIISFLVFPNVLYPIVQLNNFDTNYVEYLQLSAGVLKGHGLDPAAYVNYGINGAYKYVKAKNESSSFAVAIPSNYDRLSPSNNLRIGFSSNDIAGYVKFRITYRFFSLNEDVSTENAEFQVDVTGNVSAVSGGYNYAYINLQKPSDSDKIIMFDIQRMSSEDTVVNDIYVIGISLVYYANKLGG